MRAIKYKTETQTKRKSVIIYYIPSVHNNINIVI